MPQTIQAFKDFFCLCLSKKFQELFLSNQNIPVIKALKLWQDCLSFGQYVSSKVFSIWDQNIWSISCSSRLFVALLCLCWQGCETSSPLSFCWCEWNNCHSSEIGEATSIESGADCMQGSFLQLTCLGKNTKGCWYFECEQNKMFWKLRKVRS
jgi:hypothetical protein